MGSWGTPVLEDQPQAWGTPVDEGPPALAPAISQAPAGVVGASIPAAGQVPVPTGLRPAGSSPGITDYAKMGWNALTAPEPTGTRPGVLGNAATAVHNVGARALTGLHQAVTHPIDTLQSAAEMTPPGQVVDTALGRQNPIEEASRDFQNTYAQDKPLAFENVAGDALASYATGKLGSEVLPAAAQVAGKTADVVSSAGGAVRDAAIGDPDVAALRGLRVPAGSKQALPVLKAVDQARPYLQGAKSLEDLQSAVPAAKKAIIEPYDQAIKTIGSKVVQGPDGPTTIKALDNERAMLSANLRTLKAGGPEAIQLATQKGMNQADLLGRQRAVENYLYPHLEDAGINPQEIMNRYGSVARIGSRISGQSTLNEPSQHYGAGRITNLSIKQPFKAPEEVIGGIRDLVAGRPIWSGKPTDVGIREAFRNAGPRPDLGAVNPSAQVSPQVIPPWRAQQVQPRLAPPGAPQLNAPAQVTPQYVSRAQLVGQSAPQLGAPPEQPMLGAGQDNPEYVTPSSNSYPPLNQATAQTSVYAGTPRPLQPAIPQRTINVSPEGQAAIQRPALPPPETHAFSQKAWKAQHPNGNLKTAVKQATAKGFRVVD